MATRSGRRPFAVAFLERNLGASKNSRMPPGCSFLALGGDGPIFYTLPKDHFNYAVGARTHNVRLSAGREKETEQTLRRRTYRASGRASGDPLCADRRDSCGAATRNANKTMPIGGGNEDQRSKEIWQRKPDRNVLAASEQFTSQDKSARGDK